MRLATYLDPAGTRRAGVVVEDRVFALPGDTTVEQLVERGLSAALEMGARAVTGEGTALAGVRLQVPLRPASIRDFVTFEEHVEGVRRSIDRSSGVPDAWYDAPTFYFTNPHALVAADEEVAFPARSVARDLELEVAVVVQGEGRSLDEAAARDHVFGYTLMNDWSARDLQAREMQVGLGPAKGKDFATSLGPWLVTADELEDRRDPGGFLDLACRVLVNGDVIGEDRLAHMGWTFEAMIAHASRDSRVVAGDVMGSGTTGHGGCLAELWGRHGRQDPPPLRDGDVVTLEVEGLGRLSNRVTSAPASPAAPAVSRRTPAERDAARTASVPS
ncbi:2-keto-4-pentenoate hydratase/2-oxohepta-3-ene-1,7-dioic acid hydratase (catechol pathway) [Nocardioides scoriae]|uniref:2-keto-4-pentenoate hydratase/2-oxohepta-3-ene-1,7-dioic acid hydratase (Catechol pathway) n=1 Tax=Nocardioides scoriae TaxID=642780 RepID=A0A1H1PDF1_9ACTN|nr:fumarylacetoacetate hydrolase family protein [Nocardioides scoriae]SDS09301.1 2-keto-4-pentenoate hydratase/2-oxohepta-3-ene-1,7-dioic acid hydratase (catechol pathway) [Nocardioides scoriae]